MVLADTVIHHISHSLFSFIFFPSSYIIMYSIKAMEG